MADPISYDPSYSFSGWQAGHPSDPLPGNQVDSELETISLSLSSVVDAITDVRRSDGQLQNGLVTYDSLAAELQAQIGIGIDAALVAAQAAQEAAELAETNAEAAEAQAEAAAANMVATSATNLSIGTGSKVFTTQASKYFFVGCPVIVSSNANPTVNYMSGLVTAYSGTTLTVNVTLIAGGGTLSDWTIRVSGTPGATGATGSAGPGTGDMLKSENLSGLANYTTARSNMGLGGLAVKTTVATADIDPSSITNARMADMAANTVKVNATAGSAAPTDLALAASTFVARGATGNIVAATLGSGVTLAGGVLNVSGVKTVVRQVFTSSGTYTPTAGMIYCDVEVVGGGGGGGLPTANNPGGGGGGGGYAREIISAATIGASQSVTIGAGGTGGTVTNGGNGGSSSLGALISAGGGVGGVGGGALHGGGAGGTGSGGDINMRGSAGGGAGTGSALVSGAGGDSYFCGGAIGVSGVTVGSTGQANSGGGGSGGGATGGSSAGNGGAGGSGIVIVTEYCS